MYPKNKRCKIAFIVTTILLQFVYHIQGDTKDYWWQERSRSNCQYTDFGYKPSGSKTIIVDEIAPEAIINSNKFLEKIGGRAKITLGFGEKAFDKAGLVTNDLFEAVSDVAVKAKKFAKTAADQTGEVLGEVAKYAPKLANSIGIFGAVFEIFLEKHSTSIDDIIEATNGAFGQLTKDVNNRMDEMKGYVDSQILASEKEAITCELTILSKYWMNCVGEMTTEQSIDCQRAASRLIRSSLCKFMSFESQFQKRNKAPFEDLTGDQTRRLEMTLHGYRVYVTLSISVIETLVQMFKDHLQEVETNYEEEEDTDKKIQLGKIVKQTQMKHVTFLTEEVSDITKYINYAEWALEQITNVHTNNQNVVDENKNVVFNEDGTVKKKEVNHCTETFKCKKGKKMYSQARLFYKPYVGTIYTCTCMFDKTFYPSEKCAMDILYMEKFGSPWEYEDTDDPKFKLRRYVPKNNEPYTTTYEQIFYQKIIGRDISAATGYNGYIRLLKQSMKNYWNGYLRTSIEQWKINLEVITKTRNDFLNKHGLSALKSTATQPTEPIVPTRKSASKKSKKQKKEKAKNE